MADESTENVCGSNNTQGSSWTNQVSNLAPTGWRLRLAKAAAQLIAGSEKGAIAYGEIRDRLDTIEGRSIISKGLADAVLQQAINDPDIMERAKARFLGGVLQKQENLEAVITQAAQNFLALPPPESNNNEFRTGEDEANIPDDNADDQSKDNSPLDEDWAATFSTLAENANSDQLRSRLSKILSGELRHPGTYSRSTVRRIAELEQADLVAMQNIMPQVFQDQILVFWKEKQRNPTISQILPLADAALVSESGSSLSRSWPEALEDNEIAWFVGKQWAISVSLKKGQRLQIPMIPLTKTGIAVADLLGRHDEREILINLCESIPADTYNKIEIGRVISEKQVRLPLEKVK